MHWNDFVWDNEIAFGQISQLSEEKKSRLHFSQWSLNKSKPLKFIEFNKMWIEK